MKVHSSAQEGVMQEKCRLAGAKFIILNSNHEQIMCVQTDSHGEAIIDGLPYGRYYIKEVDPPMGYHRCEETVELEISENNCDRCVEFVNRRKTGSIKIIKYGI